MIETYTTIPSRGQFWGIVDGDSHAQTTATDPMRSLAGHLGTILRSDKYNCSVRIKRNGLSGDTTRTTTAGVAGTPIINPGMRERASKMIDPNRPTPTFVLWQIGVNNTANALTNANITDDLKSAIIGLRNKCLPRRGSPVNTYQSGIVPDWQSLPPGMPNGTRMLVCSDDATSDGVTIDELGNSIPTTALTSTSSQWTYNRKLLGGVPNINQVWVARNYDRQNYGWHRTYSEEDYVAVGAKFTPHVRYFVVIGLHLYYGSEASGSASASNTLVRTAQSDAVAYFTSYGAPYKNSSGQDILFVDTFTPMSALVTTAPAADPSLWSCDPAGSNNHLGADGNGLVAAIIAAKLRASTTTDGRTWTAMLGGTA